MIDAMSGLPLFSFLWPEMLWLLGFVVAAAMIFRHVLRQTRSGD